MTIRTRFSEKLVNRLMEGGKKGAARRLFDAALEMARKRIHGAASCGEILGGAVKATLPLVEVRRRRIAGRVYDIPILVTPKRRVFLATRWLVAEAHDALGRSMPKRLSGVLIKAYKGEVT